MLDRGSFGVVVGLVLLAAAASSCSSSAVALDQGCSINSDCAAQLVCTFGRCHDQCKTSRDCASGERCIVSASGGVCQLAQDSTCAAGYLCPIGEVCGADQQCRVQCVGGGCITGDYCLISGATSACYSPSSPADEPSLLMAGILSADGALIGSDGSSATGASSGADGSEAATGPGGGGGGDATVETNACLSAQTQFGNTARGDSNPNFTSGVGVRT